VTLLFAVAPSRKVDRRETERGPEERRSWCLDMRTGAVLQDPSTPEVRRSALGRRHSGDVDFDGPDAA